MMGAAASYRVEAMSKLAKGITIEGELDNDSPVSSDRLALESKKAIEQASVTDPVYYFVDGVRKLMGEE